MTKHEFIDAYGKNIFKLVIRRNTNFSFDHKLLEMVKKKFFEVIRDNYISKHLDRENTGEMNINLENLTIFKQSEITRKEKIIRNMLSLIDMQIEQTEVNLSLTGDEGTYYSIMSDKLILGAVKGINKHKEIHFILIALELRIKEYVTCKGELNEFLLFSNQKVFLNAKLEYGLFPKHYSLINTLNIKLDISGALFELSTRALESLFSQIVKPILFSSN
jgi:hypothetical protein